MTTPRFYCILTLGHDGPHTGWKGEEWSVEDHPTGYLHGYAGPAADSQAVRLPTVEQLAREDACLTCDNQPERHCYRCGACPTGMNFDLPALGVLIHRLPENHPTRCFCGDPLHCSTAALLTALAEQP
jgi:hypothetical protein